MRLILFFIFICIPSLLLGQDKICFKSYEELQQIAQGTWQVDNQGAKHYYKITFKESQRPVLEILENLDVIENRPGSKYDLAFRTKDVLSIENFDDCYSIGIEVKAKFGSVFNELKFMDTTSFIYKKNRFVRAAF